MISDDEATPTHNVLLHTRSRDSNSLEDDIHLNSGSGETTTSGTGSAIEAAPDGHLWHAGTRSPYYDPAIEKSLSHTEARLYHQQERQEYNSSTANQSPVLHSRSGFPHHESDAGALSRTSSVASSSKLGRKYAKASSAINGSKPYRYGDDINLPEALKGYSQLSNEANQAGHQTEFTEDYEPQLTIEHGIDEKPSTGPTAGFGGHVSAANNVTPEVSIIYANIQKVLDIRHKYIRLSLQRPNDNPKDDPSWNIYPPPPEPVWDDEQGRPSEIRAGAAQRTVGENISSEFSAISDKPMSSPNAVQTPHSPSQKRRKAGHDIGSDFDFSDCHLAGTSEKLFEMDQNGVYQVYDIGLDGPHKQPIITIPTIREYYMDLESVLAVSSDGPSKSFAFRRLQYLEGKFSLYVLVNDYQETADARRVPHRDFYNVRKVDTHVHHSSCMNQKHLLRFIKSKMKKSSDEVVMHRDGKHLTLKQVFESINLTAYDLSIDTLDMHVSLIDFLAGQPGNEQLC